MKTNEIWKSLSESDRKGLIYALEQEQPHYVKLADGTFIGVNITNEPQLIIESTEGNWVLGKVKE